MDGFILIGFVFVAILLSVDVDNGHVMADFELVMTSMDGFRMYDFSS